MGISSEYHGHNNLRSGVGFLPSIVSHVFHMEWF